MWYTESHIKKKKKKELLHFQKLAGRNHLPTRHRIYISAERSLEAAIGAHAIMSLTVRSPIPPTLDKMPTAATCVDATFFGSIPTSRISPGRFN